MSERRIVLVDKHVVVQCFSGTWYTCSKNTNSDATGLAVWRNTPANMRRAQAIAGEGAPVVTAPDTLYSGEVGHNEWCINADEFESRYGSQVEAVAALAQYVA